MKRAQAEVMVYARVISTLMVRFSYAVLHTMKGQWVYPPQEAVRQRLLVLREDPQTEADVTELFNNIPLKISDAEKLERYIENRRPNVGTMSKEDIRRVSKRQVVQLDDGSLFFPSEEDVDEAKVLWVSSQNTSYIPLEEEDEETEDDVEPLETFLCDRACVHTPKGPHPSKMARWETLFETLNVAISIQVVINFWIRFFKVILEKNSWF
jgi:hypothetical protein